MAKSNTVAEKLKVIPDLPGVYKFLNIKKEISYVGQAKSIKKRVQSYFNKAGKVNRKTWRMSREVRDIQYTVVNSESDAFHLENSLIKKNQPRYNIQLKDDKSYPYICITSERFPRIFSTRRYIPSRGKYYGPYASVKGMNNVLNLLKNLYTIRTCKYNLSKENIEQGKFKVCLEYHIKNCKGPCENLQSEEDYNKDINQCENILKGNISVVRDYFQKTMQEFAGKMEFELAGKYKNKLQLLDRFQAKTLVVNRKISDLDVFTVLPDEKRVYVNFIKVKKGSIILSQTKEVKKRLDEVSEDILGLFIYEYRLKFKSKAREVLTNIPVDIPIREATVIVPQRGDKKKLIELSLKNSWYYKKEILSHQTKQNESRTLKLLQSDLQLKNLPYRIECFDNSNIQGSSPVASMVCFKNGKPSKENYRRYNIKTVASPDDFSSMYEIVYRRYRRLMEEVSPLPDLVIIDGGKGQLNAAKKALSTLDLYGKIPLIGIAKRLEEIYFPDDQYPLHIEKKSESLKLIQRIRNEAHRFAIAFHRAKRSKNAFKSVLEEIKGIGPKTTQQLLRKFKSVENIIGQDRESLSEVIGKSKAELVYTTLKKQKG